MTMVMINFNFIFIKIYSNEKTLTYKVVYIVKRFNIGLLDYIILN